jgi:hypothetical protein
MQISGEHHEYVIRDQKPGGGTSIFIKENINYKLRSELTFSPIQQP